jgi:hypothetical protein
MLYRLTEGGGARGGPAAAPAREIGAAGAARPGSGMRAQRSRAVTVRYSAYWYSTWDVASLAVVTEEVSERGSTATLSSQTYCERARGRWPVILADS